MSLFRRGRPEEPERVSTPGQPEARPAPHQNPTVTPISAFWRWWAGAGADQLAGAIESGDYGSLPSQITDRVHAIDRGLEWELGPGQRARHRLCVTAAGVAELRPLAQRWRRAAPAEDQVWEYEPARTRHDAVAGAVLQVAGADLGLDHVAVDATFDDNRQVFDVRLHHPDLAKLPEKAQQQFGFLALDWALGEDDVERWLGAIETAPGPTDVGLSLPGLVAAVDQLAAEPIPESWVLLGGQTDSGQPRMASVRRPLKWIDHPLLDQHNLVVLSFRRESRPDGLPTPAGLDRLRQQEESLQAAVGPRAELLAHETGEGSRTLHLYSDSEDQNVTAAIADWCREHGADFSFEPDPAWRAVRQLG